MTNPIEPTPAEVFAARRSDIARLLDVLQMELERHEGKHEASPKDWGLAGDLGKVRSDLVSIIAFMSGKDPEEVEHFLEDAERAVGVKKGVCEVEMDFWDLVCARSVLIMKSEGTWPDGWTMCVEHYYGPRERLELEAKADAHGWYEGCTWGYFDNERKAVVVAIDDDGEFSSEEKIDTFLQETDDEEDCPRVRAAVWITDNLGNLRERFEQQKSS